MKFREEVSRGVSRGRKIHLKHPGRGSRLPPPSVSPKHRPDKVQKTPSADYRRQEIRRGRRYKESRPAGGRKVAQEEEK
jgi:hypothetical protein